MLVIFQDYCSALSTYGILLFATVFGRSHRFGGNKYLGGGTYSDNVYTDTGKANKRDVWPMASAGYKGSHCAPFPEELPKTCILASTKEGDTVLDPFVGSGTTAVVAQSFGRKWIGIDLDTTEAKGRLAC